MRTSTILLIGAAFAGAALAPVTADAAVSVAGKGLSRSCFDHAESGRDLDEGIQHCNRALTDEPMTLRDRAATFVNRGIIRVRSKDVPAGVKDYDSALRIKPDLAEAHVNKGIALVYLGGHDAEAIEAISRGIQLKTERPEIAYYHRGIANELLGNDEAAYNDYRQAATLKPDWAEPQLQLRRFGTKDKRG